MKRDLRAVNIICILLISVISFSCVNDREQKDKQITDSVTNEDTITIINTYADKMWIYDTEADTMIKNHIPANLSLEMVLNAINTEFCEDNCLDYIKTSKDTIFLKINDTSHLSKWGSTGNYAFMAEVIYSFTELPNVRYVDLDFEESDHASPGVYQRSDFNRESD